MADQQDKSDIDEVLTSVLRLVSDDLRVPGRVQAMQERLVLTEAQRVAAPAAAPAIPPAAIPPASILPAAVPEAVLREMIRDTLREELRGPLGERITRNVRKLVLAEMRRTAVLRDLD